MSVTEKNTKKEIWTELRTTAKLLKESQMRLAEEKKRYGVDAKAELKAAKQKAVIRMAAELDPDSIRNERLKITEFYSSIENKAREVKEQLDTLYKGKEALEAEIEELHGIKVKADTLEGLLRAHAEERESFEAEQNEARSRWRRQHEQIEQEYCEKKEDLEKNFKRREEEWHYAFNRKSKMDMDSWELEKQKRLRELEEEERAAKEELKKADDAIAEKHEEFMEYKKQVEEFPQKLTEAVEAAKAETARKLEQSTHFKVEQLKKDNQIHTSVLEHKVKDLTERNEELARRTAELTARLDSASEKVESIAREAITGAAKQKFSVYTGGDKDK
jgi:DNA repair exonuclease SbcCD ATPase subunit